MRQFQHQAMFGIWLDQTKYFPSLGLCNAQSKCYKIKGYFNLGRQGQADLSLLCSTSQWTYLPKLAVLPCIFLLCNQLLEREANHLVDLQILQNSLEVEVQALLQFVFLRLDNNDHGYLAHFH